MMCYLEELLRKLSLSVIKWKQKLHMELELYISAMRRV